MQPIRVAVVGAGYWGPNLVRNFAASDSWDLAAVCDLDNPAKKVAGGLARVATSVESLLERNDLDAVAVATPATTHRPIAWRLSPPASTCWSRSRLRTPRPTPRDRRRRQRPGPGADVRPPTATPRSCRRSLTWSATVLWGTSTSSTRCGSTSGWSSATSTSSGTSRRTTCPFSTTSSPGAPHPGGGHRPWRGYLLERAASASAT